MSSESLKQEIRKTAAQNAERVLAEANTEAARILAEAESDAGRIMESRVQDSQRLLDQVERSEAAKARMECQRSLSTTQARCVEDAFREAESRVYALPSSDPDLYGRALGRFIQEARAELGDSRLVVVARDQDREVVKEILRGFAEERREGPPQEYSISPDSLDARGGVMLHSEDLRVYYVNTLDSRFQRGREELRAKVVDVLLKGGP